MRCLFDTDHIVALLRNHASVRSRIDSLPEEVELHTSVITAAELFYGAHGAKDSARRVDEVKRFLADMDVLGLDLEGAETYGRLKARLRAQGQLIADNDLYIASIALRHGSSFSPGTRDTTSASQTSRWKTGCCPASENSPAFLGA